MLSFAGIWEEIAETTLLDEGEGRVQNGSTVDDIVNVWSLK